MTWKIGHRGACGYAPENTLASFRQALELGADGVECDVHLCKSGEPVIIHDATLERTTSGSGSVAQHTLSELKQLDAGQGETIPSLDELILAIAPHARIFIEIKDGHAVPAVAQQVGHHAARYGYEALPVISFHSEFLGQIKRIDPRILIGATPPEKGMPADFPALAKAGGMWSVNPNIDTLEEIHVAKAHSYGLKVITWTANSLSQIHKAQKLGVDGIISDFPDRL